MNTFDTRLIPFFNRIAVPLARISLFIVFFWFGILKVIGLSPAGSMVHSLFDVTLSWLMPFNLFYISFALLECAIGIMFLIPGLERIAIVVLFLHMITTILPLFCMPEATWQQPFVPTLEGQYIIKNLLIITAAVFIGAQLKPRQVVSTP
jgi:uncharacterized membrane protein YkgB